ncbi:hypothetical protein COLO4_02686 [Corchorus olitorius]|uniref:Uncharacterized protein n=1 Tax=Corchorus olitorius TaxID=93759 RepID=A0A1R3L0H1_9ROSI|nr:hypothetical protein COLO4_02686 [Corchorus olitorius]
MEADLRLRASRTLRIVVEDDDGVTRLRAALLLLVVALLVLDAERQAFLGQQAHHERVVGFAVLAADRSFGARLRCRNLVMRAGVFAEDVFDDLDRAGSVRGRRRRQATRNRPRNRATRVACRRLALGAATNEADTASVAVKRSTTRLSEASAVSSVIWRVCCPSSAPRTACGTAAGRLDKGFIGTASRWGSCCGSAEGWARGPSWPSRQRNRQVREARPELDDLRIAFQRFIGLGVQRVRQPEEAQQPDQRKHGAEKSTAAFRA